MTSPETIQKNPQQENKSFSLAVAEKVVYKTPSERNSVIIIDQLGDTAYLGEGQYGGYIYKKGSFVSPDDAVLALMCFKREFEKLEWDVAVQKYPQLAALNDAIAKYEAPEPAVRVIRYFYQPVELIKKKETEKYVVYDVKPVGDVITAEAVHVHWGRYFSARGRCYGSACADELDKIKLATAAAGLELYELPAGKRSDEFRAKVVTDASQLEPLIRTAVQPPAEEEDVEEEEEGAEEEKREKRGVDVSTVAAEVEKAAALEVELEEPAVSAPAVQQQHEHTAVQRRELVQVYLLRMRLPSKYLVQEVEYADRGRQEIRKFTDDRASALETLRRRIYEQISRVFCAVEEYGVWIAVSEEAVKEAAQLGGLVKDELRRLGFDEKVISRYDVKAVKVYMEPGEAKELLEAAVRQLSAEVEELEKRIAQAEAEAKKSAVRRLAQDLSYRRALLETFKKVLTSL